MHRSAAPTEKLTVAGGDLASALRYRNEHLQLADVYLMDDGVALLQMLEALAERYAFSPSHASLEE